jgi:hypothetical protein
VGKINEALEFAQEELAPRGEENVSSTEIISSTPVRTHIAIPVSYTSW